eukprot:scaffold328_cov130-Cylindrotheca_fusiformis.AAC.21
MEAMRPFLQVQQGAGILSVRITDLFLQGRVGQTEWSEQTIYKPMHCLFHTFRPDCHFNIPSRSESYDFIYSKKTAITPAMGAWDGWLAT